MFTASVTWSSHLILWWPLLLLLSIFSSIRDLSNESSVHIRWPKYWSFSFSISPSSEYPGLISLKIDWFDLLAVQGTLRSFLQHHSSKASILWCSSFYTVQLSQPYVTIGKTIALTIQTFVSRVMLCFSTHCLGLSLPSCQEAIIWFHGLLSNNLNFYFVLFSLSISCVLFFSGYFNAANYNVMQHRCQNTREH